MLPHQMMLTLLNHSTPILLSSTTEHYGWLRKPSEASIQKPEVPLKIMSDASKNFLSYLKCHVVAALGHLPRPHKRSTVVLMDVQTNEECRGWTVPGPRVKRLAGDLKISWDLTFSDPTRTHDRGCRLVHCTMIKIKEPSPRVKRRETRNFSESQKNSILSKPQEFYVL